MSWTGSWAIENVAASYSFEFDGVGGPTGDTWEPLAQFFPGYNTDIVKYLKKNKLSVDVQHIMGVQGHTEPHKCKHVKFDIPESSEPSGPKLKTKAAARKRRKQQLMLHVLARLAEEYCAQIRAKRQQRRANKA